MAIPSWRSTTPSPSPWLPAPAPASHCSAGWRADPRINADRRFHAVRGHLLERNGNRQAALDAYQEAARRATNLQQQRYLNRQIARLQDSS